MGQKKTICSALALILVFLSIMEVVVSMATTIPSDKSAVERWFSSNVRPYKERKSEIDSALSAAEAGAKVVRVRKDGTGDFRTITAAINSIPSGNKHRVIIAIGGGVYTEKIKIDRTKPFITLYGSPHSMPNLTYSGTAAKYGTVDSASLIVESDYFMAVNIVIKNSAPRPDGKRAGAQAVALRISGDKAAFYNCKLIGFQDTLCDDRGRHFFKNCLIVGTVDFIFGSGRSLYLNTRLYVDVKDEGFTIITAHAREQEGENTGYSFVHGRVDGSGKNNTFLGRAWKSRPKVVFSYTEMSPVVNSAGWSINFHPQNARTVYFGEYQCVGLGANPGRRAGFVKKLTGAEAKPFVTMDYIQASSWLLPPPRL